MSVFYSEVSAKNYYKPYIQKFWILNNSQNSLNTPVSYALPNGCCTIVFISGNGAVLNPASKPINLPMGVYMSGQITKRTGILLKPFSKAIMAQVKPWLPPIVSNIRMNELVDNVMGLENINHSLHHQLTDIDLANENLVIPALYQALDAYLHVGEDSDFIQWVCKRLQFGALKQTSIADITAASGYSQRRFEQKFRTLIGLTAKELQQILQLRQLINDLSKPSYSINLGTLALQYGYYDQSHFIRSYKRIISEAPSQFNLSEYLVPLTGHFDFLQL